MKIITKAQAEKGTAIVLVISILATLMVIVGVSAEYTTHIRRQVERSNTLESAITLADGCVEHAFAQWRQRCRVPGTTTPPTTTQLNALQLPTQAEFPDIANFSSTRALYNPTVNKTVQQCRVIAIDPQGNAMANGTSPTPSNGQQVADLTFNYLASAYVSLPAAGGGKVVAKVQRVLQEQKLSPWNFAIFYHDPLEIHPGPDFDVTGWVHTNSDLYTGHKTLHFQDKATFSGNWYVGFMPGDGSHTSDTPANPTWPMNPEIRPDHDSPHLPFNLDPADFDPGVAPSPPPNPNNTGYHELIEPPDLSNSVDPLQGARYYEQADVIIKIDASNIVTLSAPNADGTVRILNGSAPETGSQGKHDNDLYAMFSAAGVITPDPMPAARPSIQDNREASAVRVVTLDVSKMTASSSVSTDVNGVKWTLARPNVLPFNGIVYVYDTSAAPTGVGAKRGVRLKNGKVIPNQGLTVASLNPIYIQGDYNTGANPLSNSGDPTKPEGTLPSNPSKSYTRQPCSVIGDAVNLLSNSWTDANSANKQQASPTTFNTAIVSGIVPSGSDSTGQNYSGGAENFPRFLEDWGGKDLTYYGSMVELYRSQQAIGSWRYGGNVYEAPLRKWYFDTNFQFNTPPGTLMTFTYSKGRWSLVP